MNIPPAGPGAPALPSAGRPLGPAPPKATMSYQVLAPGTEPCVWMRAGLIRYRLCTRGFDCESCPLDAALRGELLARPRRASCLTWRRASGVFPDDRLYSAGHTWLQALGGNGAGIWRLGLDAFAAAIIGAAEEVLCEPSGRGLERGEPVCGIDVGLGVLRIGAPVRGRVVRGNDVLRGAPERVVAEPYDDGWIVDLAVSDPAELAGLLTPDGARDRTTGDLRHFRRAVAASLLATLRTGRASSNGDDAEAFTDLRELLGGGVYLELVGRLVH